MKYILILVSMLLTLTNLKAEIEFINHVRDIKVYSQLVLINMSSKEKPEDIKYIQKSKRLYVEQLQVVHYQNFYNLTEINSFINTLYKGNYIIIYSNKEPAIAIAVANYLERKNPKLTFKVLENNFEY